VRADADAEAAAKVARDKDDERKMYVSMFESAKADASSSEYSYQQMRQAAGRLGGDYQKQFDSTPMPASLAAFNARWNSADPAPSSSVGGSTSPLATVEVRNYSGGNYTGSVMVSPFWASVMSMTSASH
jgi:hypothetical protein